MARQGGKAQVRALLIAPGSARRGSRTQRRATSHAAAARGLAGGCRVHRVEGSEAIAFVREKRRPHQNDALENRLCEPRPQLPEAEALRHHQLTPQPTATEAAAWLPLLRVASLASCTLHCTSSSSPSTKCILLGCFEHDKRAAGIRGSCGRSIDASKSMEGGGHRPNGRAVSEQGAVVVVCRGFHRISSSPSAWGRRPKQLSRGGRPMEPSRSPSSGAPPFPPSGPPVSAGRNRSLEPDPP